MAKKKVYICGKVTGEERIKCKAKFEARADILIEKGYDPVNPMEFVHESAEWDEAMKQCIGEMMKCDYITYLDDVDNSEGATFERDIAIKLNMEELIVLNMLQIK